MASIDLAKLQQAYDASKKRVARLNRSKHSTVPEYKDTSESLLALVADCLNVHRSFEEREKRLQQQN